VIAGGLFGYAKEATLARTYNAGAVTSTKLAAALGVTSAGANSASAAYYLAAAGAGAEGVTGAPLLTATGAAAAGATLVSAVDTAQLAELADALGAAFTTGTSGLAGVAGVTAPVLMWQMPSNRVTYVLNGGTNAESNPDVQLQGQAVVLAAPTRAGFTFTGWYTNAALSAKITTLAASQKADITLYAGWSSAFADVAAGAWYDTPIKFVAARGLISGYGTTGTTFGVGDPMTRAQLATILWRYSCADEYAAYDAASAKNTSGMKDVEAGAYYTAAANWAKTAGIITGFQESNGTYTFRPGTNVSFEQLVVILARMCGSEAQIAAADTSVLAAFTDAGAVSSWAKQEMAWAVKVGLVSGYGDARLAPAEDVSRERASTLLYKAFNLGFLE
jgi:uncharacterized repeat protein (TIGR02543 family)